MKQTLRKCPDLQFYLDDSLDYAENIDRLLGLSPTAPAPEAPKE